MPSWLTLTLFILGCTMVVPIFVWGNTMNWRRALEAWWEFARYLLLLASPALLYGAWTLLIM